MAKPGTNAATPPTAPIAVRSFRRDIRSYAIQALSFEVLARTRPRDNGAATVPDDRRNRQFACDGVHEVPPSRGLDKEKSRVENPATL
jgi:hypothetical protein